MTLRDYLRIFRRRWPIILACVLVGAGVTWVVSSDVSEARPTSYTATATLLVSAAPNTADPQLRTSVNLNRIALFVKNGEIPQRVAAALGGTADAAALAAQVQVVADPAAGALTITTESSDADRAAARANAFADQTVAYYEGARDGALVSILQRAVAIPQTPSGGIVVPPGKLPRSLLAGALGLLFGLGLALIVHQLDSRLRTRDQVHKALRMPVIAEVPKLSKKNAASLIVVDEPLSPFADAYRSARTAITHLPSQFVQADGEAGPARGMWGKAAKVVLVTSGMPGEGKTTSAANLAASFAETGMSVLVLDADLRKPDTHLRLDVPQGAGISNHLVHPKAHPLPTLIRPTRVPGVRMITAGTELNAPAALVSRMEPVLNKVRGEADVVIVDSAPLLAASDVFDLLPLVDTVLLVVRSGRLTDAAGERIAEVLGRFSVPVIGAMLIGAPVGSDGYGMGYGYGYGRGYGRSETEASETGSAEAPDRPASPVDLGPVQPGLSAQRAQLPSEAPAAGPDRPAPSEQAPRSVWTT